MLMSLLVHAEDTDCDDDNYDDNNDNDAVAPCCCCFPVIYLPAPLQKSRVLWAFQAKTSNTDAQLLLLVLSFIVVVVVCVDWLQSCVLLDI